MECTVSDAALNLKRVCANTDSVLHFMDLNTASVNPLERNPMA
jgi:hypothetical protein